jgi:hypothetical protein
VWEHAATREPLGRAATSYAVRRAALVSQLDGHGIGARGRSGLGVWVLLAAALRDVVGTTAATYSA